jgi:hypothetical protein
MTAIERTVIAAMKDVNRQQRPAGLWQSKSAIKADDRLNLTQGERREHG